MQSSCSNTGRWAYSLSFFFNDTATTEIYTLSLHDALPICVQRPELVGIFHAAVLGRVEHPVGEQLHPQQDRKSTRLNSSHSQISYAVFCLKKKKICSICRTQDRSIIGVMRSGARWRRLSEQ